MSRDQPSARDRSLTPSVPSRPGHSVKAWSFFYFCLSGPEDLDLHRLASQRALELATARFRLPKPRSRNHLLASTHRRLPAALEQMLPARKQRPRDAQLTAQLRERHLATL